MAKKPQKLRKTCKTFFSEELGPRNFFIRPESIEVSRRHNLKILLPTQRPCGAPDPSPNFRLFQKARFEFCRSSRPFLKTKRPDSSKISERVLLVERRKNFIDESSHAFFRGVEEQKKSKNDYCYKCSKFDKRERVYSGGSKIVPRKKYLKKIKILRFFRGSHFVLVGRYNLDFSIFYHGIGSTYLELLIRVVVKIRLSIKMRPLGAPGPPATKISTWDSTVMQYN